MEGPRQARIARQLATGQARSTVEADCAAGVNTHGLSRHRSALPWRHVIWLRFRDGTAGEIEGGLELLWHERPNQPATAADLQIIERADALLADECRGTERTTRSATTTTIPRSGACIAPSKPRAEMRPSVASTLRSPGMAGVHLPRIGRLAASGMGHR